MSGYLAQDARMNGTPSGWLREWAWHNAPDLCERHDAEWFAAYEVEAGKPRKGEGMKPLKIAHLLQIEEWELVEFYGPNGQHRGGLVWMEWTPEVAKERRRVKEAERKRAKGRADGRQPRAEYEAQAKADRDEAARLGVHPRTIKRRREKAEAEAVKVCPQAHPLPQYEMADTLGHAPPADTVSFTQEGGTGRVLVLGRRKNAPVGCVLSVLTPIPRMQIAA